jgi:hypothetical protein
MPLSLAHFCAKENQCGIVTLKKGMVDDARLGAHAKE